VGTDTERCIQNRKRHVSWRAGTGAVLMGKSAPDVRGATFCDVIARGPLSARTILPGVTERSIAL
jgi:hypothetical protein